MEDTTAPSACEDWLYHYTCSDGLDGIRKSGRILPNLQPLLGEPLIWLTDLDIPNRWALGLTSQTLGCDRTAHRLVVPRSPSVMHWPVYCRARRTSREVREALEFDRLPVHWYVSTEALVPAEVAA